jgi:hypothetical protein
VVVVDRGWFRQDVGDDLVGGHVHERDGARFNLIRDPKQFGVKHFGPSPATWSLFEDSDARLVVLFDGRGSVLDKSHFAQQVAEPEDVHCGLKEGKRLGVSAAGDAQLDFLGHYQDCAAAVAEEDAPGHLAFPVHVDLEAGVRTSVGSSRKRFTIWSMLPG